MFEVASQIIICLILAALIGGIIGYLLGKGTCAEQSKCNEGTEGSHELHIDQQNNEASTNESPSTDTDVQPTLLSKARNGKKDNLQLIKGVGKILEGVLNKTGIYHFDQIANLTEKEISWLDNSMSFPGRIEREEWVTQAKDLAAGVETEFSQRVERGEVASSKKSK